MPSDLVSDGSSDIDRAISAGEPPAVIQGKTDGFGEHRNEAVLFDSADDRLGDK